jgi:hypothetical protein
MRAMDGRTATLILRRADSNPHPEEGEARLEGRGLRIQRALETPSSFETPLAAAPQDESYGQPPQHEGYGQASSG